MSFDLCARDPVYELEMYRALQKEAKRKGETSMVIAYQREIEWWKERAERACR